MMKQYHPFHMITPSPWPIMNSIMSWNMTSYLLWSFYNNINNNIIIYIMLTITLTFSWWTNIISETTKQGSHFFMISKGLKMGMILFIVSEVMFFFSFFWSYFHSSISPNMEIGMEWPPKNISLFNPMNVPLLNTIILVSSGISITWTHNEMMKKNMKNSIKSLMITCMLGMYFTTMQMMEYSQAEFNISCSIYSSTFFMATGFHGIHVMIGTIFLIFIMNQMTKMKSNPFRMLGFEMAAWYWHFVDMVWLFLYLTIYWWSY